MRFKGFSGRQNFYGGFLDEGEGTAKVHPRTGHEGPEGKQIIALLFLQIRR
jgi:hypothetical protein